MLEWLYKHPDLIPESWKDKVVYFWGTIFRNWDGVPVVRCLNRLGCRWYRDNCPIHYDWHDREPAAVTAGVF